MATKQSSSNNLFGWKAVWQNYGWKGLLKDSIIPFSAAIGISAILISKGTDTLQMLDKILSIGIDVVPAMVALILAAYAIMLTFIAGDSFANAKKNEAGKNLIKRINANFSACLFVSTLTTVTMIIVSLIASMGIECRYANIINFTTFFVVCYLLLYSVAILFGIIIDIFNAGQTIVIDNN